MGRSQYFGVPVNWVKELKSKQHKYDTKAFALYG